MKNKKIMRSIVTLSMLIAVSAQACFVTVTNDSGQSVILYDLNSPEAGGKKVEVGEVAVFGNKTTKADFVLAQMQNGEWRKTLHIMQTMCGMTEEEEKEKKDKFLSISEILAGELNADVEAFFEIAAYNASQEASMPEKKTSSCGCHKK
jgi:hypothetical protein